LHAGKTYLGVQLMKVLLHNTSNASNAHGGYGGGHRADVGPILMACFTNHALDAFIESLIDAGVDSSGIVRVGGRSKSERVQSLNLRGLAPSAGEGPGELGAHCRCWRCPEVPGWRSSVPVPLQLSCPSPAARLQAGARWPRR
jgi:hypothetical protein